MRDQGYKGSEPVPDAPLGLAGLTSVCALTFLQAEQEVKTQVCPFKKKSIVFNNRCTDSFWSLEHSLANHGGSGITHAPGCASYPGEVVLCFAFYGQPPAKSHVSVLLVCKVASGLPVCGFCFILANFLFWCNKATPITLGQTRRLKLIRLPMQVSSDLWQLPSVYEDSRRCDLVLE